MIPPRTADDALALARRMAAERHFFDHQWAALKALLDDRFDEERGGHRLVQLEGALSTPETRDFPELIAATLLLVRAPPRSDETGEPRHCVIFATGRRAALKFIERVRQFLDRVVDADQYVRANDETLEHRDFHVSAYPSRIASVRGLSADDVIVDDFCAQAILYPVIVPLLAVRSTTLLALRTGRLIDDCIDPLIAAAGAEGRVIRRQDYANDTIVESSRKQ